MYPAELTKAARQNVKLNIFHCFRSAKKQWPVNRVFMMILSLAVVCILFSGCVARKDTILPIRTDREMLISMYKSCVTQATTNYYDDTRPPEEIVRGSLSTCQGRRNGMLRDYPPSWRTSMLKEIDEELYQSEIKWVMNKRN